MELLLILFLATVFTTFASIGATIIVTKSYLFRPLQNYFKNDYLYKLFNCPLCYSFWQGLVFQLIMMIIILGMPLTLVATIIIAFFQGCITSIASYLVYLIMIKLGHDKL